LVLAAHKAAVKAIKPGNHWNDPHVAATRVLAAGLIDLGLIDSPLEIALEEEHYRRFYMHRTGHWLGMDVHDVGNYKVDGQWRVLEPGMVMTVEPGLYIPDEDDIEPCYRGIGIRIEDDLLVTAKGSEILSKGVPRKADAIEALMASG
jgi:Xaa-Pro aminopeptidase